MKNTQGADLNKLDRAIHSAAQALGFRGRVKFKQVETKLFSLMAAGPRLTRSTETEHQAYFGRVVHPFVELAMLVHRADGIRDEIKTRARRVARICNQSRDLVDAVNARTALVRDQMEGR